MPAAIDVQQHTWQRAPRSAFAMHPALPPALYQPGSLQGQFHPGVAQCNLVLGGKLFWKRWHVRLELLLPESPRIFFNNGIGARLGGGFPRRRSERPA